MIGNNQATKPVIHIEDFDGSEFTTSKPDPIVPHKSKHSVVWVYKDSDNTKAKWRTYRKKVMLNLELQYKRGYGKNTVVPIEGILGTK